MLASAPAAAEIVTFRIESWNMESGESSDEHLKAQIGEKESIDLWGFSEVQNQTAASAFEAGAEIGESADFETILGTTGGADRLAIVYNAERLELLGSEELDGPSFGGHRKPLVARFRGRATGIEFKFMVNHLARRNASARLAQAQFLKEWAQSESMPVIASGDYNFDYHVEFSEEGERDPGFDAMLAGEEWIWVRPDAGRRQLHERARLYLRGEPPPRH